jgi:hypothetical protein
MLPHEALGNRISELSAHLNAAKAQLLELIAEFDACGGWADEGCLTCAHWLNWKCGVSTTAAREQVRVARALRELPQIHDAFARGVISYSKVRAMTRVATPDSEEYLLMLAEHGTAAHIERIVRGVRQVHAEQELRRSDERHAARYLSWNYDDNGMVVVQVRLDPEQGARLIDALQRTVDTMRAERGEDIPGEPPRPSFVTLRADALLRLIDGAQADTELVVHASAEVLADDAGAGCCELDDGSVLAPETARRLACDAGVVRLLEDAHGEPLDVGRKTRSIPPAIRRALKARDAGCRFPGCDATTHVEGHHIQHWAHGGETKLENLCSLCRFHHRLLHEGRFGVEHRGHGVFRFTWPDGEVLSDTLPRVVLERCPMDLIVQSNHARGLSIDDRTGVCKWDGVPMDASMAVEGVLQARGEFEF